MSKHVTSVPADRPSVSPLLDKYTPRIAVAAAAGKALWDAYKRLKAAQVYTITVNENDDVFLDLAEWILEHIPSVKRRSLEVRTSLHSAGDGMATPLDTTESRKREVKIRLLLEDIDVASSSHIRDDGLQRVSMAGLLNALDGIVTPHGLITVMTTNHVERLDPAIVRPGRVDHSIHVGHIDDEQLERLVRLAVGEHLNLPPVGEQQITAATIMTQVLQPNLNNPAAIPDAVAAVLAGKVD